MCGWGYVNHMAGAPPPREGTEQRQDDLGQRRVSREGNQQRKGLEVGCA